MRTGRVFALLFLMIANEAPAARTGLPVVFSIPEGLPPHYQEPWYDRALIGLGSHLFQSTALSAERNLSCSSCHRPAAALADGLPASAGTHGDLSRRNTPQIANTYAATALMWDGRASNLLEQVQLPLEAANEMDVDWSRSLTELSRSSTVQAMLQCAGRERLDRDLAIAALATFAASIVAGDSPVDEYLFSNRQDALSPNEIRGLELFRGKANCTSCHKIDSTFALLTDNAFHNVGTGVEDEGRWEVTGRVSNRGQFKTPSLRNVGQTAPYFHDGRLATLQEVVSFYRKGPAEGVENPDHKFRALDLSDTEIDALVAFLEALDAPVSLFIPSSNSTRYRRDACFAPSS